jgi:hypothetical protein
MLDRTKTDWFIVVDGDEIWFDESINEITKFLNQHGSEFESTVVPTINLIGDMYHSQEERAGLYRLAGKKGHFNLRTVNTNIPGLKSSMPHGTWGWTDENNLMIQNRDPKKIKF